MALPGIVYAFMLGVAVGTAAYSFFTVDKHKQYSYSTKSKQCIRDIPLPKRIENEQENTEGQPQIHKRKKKSTKSETSSYQNAVSLLCDMFGLDGFLDWLSPNFRAKQTV